MMKRVQKHIDSDVTATEEVLQQSNESVEKSKKNKKDKKDKKKKQSFFKMIRGEWKTISKPKPKELAVMTARTVIISVISAGVISAFDFGVTQAMVQIAKLIG